MLQIAGARSAPNRRRGVKFAENHSSEPAVNTLTRVLVASALVAAQGLATAGPRHYGHHHHHNHHRGSGLGLAIGLAVAVPLIAMAHHAEREREVVYVPPPPPPQPVYIQPQPVYTQPAPPPPRAAVPIIYPRNGQSSVQLEGDSRECNRWATTQQAAMSDASVFQRAVEACMDGRGYTMR